MSKTKSAFKIVGIFATIAKISLLYSEIRYSEISVPMIDFDFFFEKQNKIINK